MERLTGSGVAESTAWDVRIRAVSGDVLSETFDGEAVVVQLRTGAYYAFDKFSTGVWEQFMADETLGGVVAGLEGMSEKDDRVKLEVLALAHLLCDEELAIADGALPPVPVDQGEPADRPSGVTKFTDMADLLVLDPIHDIDLDGDGWPVVKEEPGTSGQSLAG
jgi:hypothetical protein